jgi:hypothetical protein
MGQATAISKAHLARFLSMAIRILVVGWMDHLPAMAALPRPLPVLQLQIQRKPLPSVADRHRVRCQQALCPPPQSPQLRRQRRVTRPRRVSRLQSRLAAAHRALPGLRPRLRQLPQTLLLQPARTTRKSQTRVVQCILFTAALTHLALQSILPASLLAATCNVRCSAMAVLAVVALPLYQEQDPVEIVT